LENGFRLFGLNRLTSPHPVKSPPAPLEPPNLPSSIVYTDGSCTDNGNLDARAGAGIWYGRDNPRNKAVRLPESMHQSNNTGELVAILIALQDGEPNTPLDIHTDSQYVIDSLYKYGPIHEQLGWIDTANKELMAKLLATLRARPGKTYLTKVLGHSGDVGNDGADSLAAAGAAKDQCDEISLEVPEALRIYGAQLQGLTQSKLYRGIRERHESGLNPRRAATVWLDITRWAAKERWGTFPTDAMIWKAIRNKTIDRKIRQYIYRVMHETT
ncbi:hypothetical protein HYPSUDRAFT_150029, partial [Hypholoma sublateritium FD-334 SS-4]